MSKKITAVLYGGPMHGVKMLVDKGTEVINVHTLKYTYAGKLKSRATAFAIKPKSRAQQRWLMHYIGKTGYDPRIEAYNNKKQPFRHETKPVKAGRGAAKRKAKRELNIPIIDEQTLGQHESLARHGRGD